jgi:dephospho-CoA kinase
MLAAHGAIVIDADAIAREVVAPGTPGLAAVIEAFGPGILHPDGSLNRPALGTIVFADDAARRTLEGITHPLIGARTAQLTGQAPADAVVVYDVPLLVEVGTAGRHGLVMVVEAPLELRLERLEGRGLPRPEALARMQHQATDEQRRAAADILLLNDGGRDRLAVQVDEVWPGLQQRAEAPA